MWSSRQITPAVQKPGLPMQSFGSYKQVGSNSTKLQHQEHELQLQRTTNIRKTYLNLIKLKPCLGAFHPTSQ